MEKYLIIMLVYYEAEICLIIGSFNRLVNYKGRLSTDVHRYVNFFDIPEQLGFGGTIEFDKIIYRWPNDKIGRVKHEE